MIANYKTNFPNMDLPPEFWFEMTDEERENAESAPPWWKGGIMPPEEFNRYMSAVE